MHEPVELQVQGKIPGVSRGTIFVVTQKEEPFKVGDDVLLDGNRARVKAVDCMANRTDVVGLVLGPA